MRLRFDFVDATGRPAPVIYERPVRTIVAVRVEDVPAAMGAAERALQDGRHVAGFVAYEAAPAFDAALTTHKAVGPLLWFGVFDAAAPVEPIAAPPRSNAPDPTGSVTVWTPDDTPAAHRHAVDAVREAIAAGDVYQVNYTFRLRSVLDPGSLEALYLGLSAVHRAPFAAHLDLGCWQVLSLSPELFFRLQGRRIETRPMKGTAPRGRWVDEDVAAAGALSTSAKDRAENVMIVDMARNDLSRIAEIGSVGVKALFDVERYPTVFQMVSTVAAEVRAGTRLGDIFTALFPAASITGAPKASSMRFIAGFESSPRGVYCGAIGYATPGGEAVFSVAIRTVTVDGATGRAVFGTGGGITWDSTAGGEYAEAIAKTACLVRPPSFDLIETLRLDAGRYVRVGQHLARLRASAEHFDFARDAGALDETLQAHAGAHPTGLRRVRLRLARDGRVSAESCTLDPPPARPAPVALAATPVDRADIFLHHKTTRRDVHEQHVSAHPGVFDVLLWNREGELTEFTRGNVVVELDGVRWTPPRTCGLLGGVFREVLLEAGEVRERVLTPDDLVRSPRVWFINSLREWVEVRLPSHGAAAQP